MEQLACYNKPMEINQVLTKEQFDQVLSGINYPTHLDWNFLYSVYSDCISSAKELVSNNSILENQPLNSISLILYICNEYVYYISAHPNINLEELNKNETYENSLASASLDKYFTNEHLSYKNKRITNRFYPPISTLSLYLNFIMGVLSRYRHNDPKQTLIIDIMSKGFSMAKCILELLTDGFETEAFSTWRTLHETECILSIIVKYGEPVVNRYLEHMHYALAFRGGIPSKEETDAVFVKIKDGMKSLDLKSKDMKRYIEYGWLSAIPDFEKIEGLKFNFRDGVERAANLSQYSKIYEMSSEIAHSSPLLIYSRKESFYLLSLVNVYESFFRLEKYFSQGYVNSITEDEKNRFLAMRQVYYPQLVAIHSIEQKNLMAISKIKKKED